MAPPEAPEGYEWTGEIRPPRPGDFYIVWGSVQLASVDHDERWPRRILRSTGPWWAVVWPGPSGGLSLFKAAGWAAAVEQAELLLAARGEEPRALRRAIPIEYAGLD